MPQIEIRCLSCDRLQTVYRHHSEWPKTPSCVNCGEATEQVILPPRERATTVDPVVVYQAEDGSFRFPPDVTTASTAMYDKQGLRRIELRGWADVRKFEQHFNKAQMSEVHRRVERQQEAFERGEKERRSEIRRCLDQGFSIPEIDDRGVATGRMRRVELSGFGRKVLEHAMANNDRKGGPRARDVGFRVDAYDSDRSNRERDPRRRDQ